ncbi:hypothetical protein ACTWPT_24420 [Nonomuraea sp. 3N208]|uniref:hypothetical protein n=1 Tax=Nonomuraea sp. 3N208 TaxID=3457421 RepID=UPI003FD33C60
MTTEARRADVLRVAGWILGVLGALLGIAALLLALPNGLDGVVSAVGVAGGSCVSVLCAIIIDHKPANRAAWVLLAGGWLLARWTMTAQAAPAWSPVAGCRDSATGWRPLAAGST